MNLLKNLHSVALSYQVPIKRIVAIYICSFLLGCTSELSTWNKAKLKNDIISYEYYIENYPNGQFYDSATYIVNRLFYSLKEIKPPVINKIVPPIREWDNLAIDCVSLNISVSTLQSQSIGSRVETIYYNTISQELNNIGITVAQKGSKPQATLTLNINARALGANYEKFGYQYLGYELNGAISLTKEGKKPITLLINKNEPCPPYISYVKKSEISGVQKPSRPEDILNSATTVSFIDYYYRVWGASPILWFTINDYDLPQELRSASKEKMTSELGNNIIRASLSDYNFIKERALALLPLCTSDSKTLLSIALYNINRGIVADDGKISKHVCTILASLGGDIAIEAVPSLILYAEISGKSGKEEVFETLRLITGENFGDDVNKWKHWWINK
jgi:hypothetical protein